jgi:hypothetical protein
MLCADLDGGVDGVADDAGVGLPGAEPNRGDLGAGVQHNRVSRHLCLVHGPSSVRTAFKGSLRRKDGKGEAARDGWWRGAI